jgi:hypothetical protein
MKKYDRLLTAFLLIFSGFISLIFVCSAIYDRYLVGEQLKRADEEKTQLKNEIILLESRIADLELMCENL